ncbi:MAG: type II toxin-antitoxin system HicB family antitoxin [Fimbriimonas ginsengisoli]|nr:type II toxin-antitoxin system HicB family antitoxin [Fimbriimonas ginsengisoli]
MKTLVFPIVIEQDDDGFYAECPALQGCHAQGQTYEETMGNIRDAVQLHVEDRRSSGEPIPTPRMLSVTTLEVSA